MYESFEQGKTEIVLLVYPLFQHGTTRIVASPKWLSNGNKPRNFGMNEWDNPKNQLLANLEAYIYAGTPKQWDLEYRDIFSADLREIKRMAKTLEKAQRFLQKKIDQDGYPTSFGQYVARVAQAFGIKTILFYGDHSASSNYDDSTYRMYGVGQAIEHIAYLVKANEGKAA